MLLNHCHKWDSRKHPEEKILIPFWRGSSGQKIFQESFPLGVAWTWPCVMTCVCSFHGVRSPRPDISATFSGTNSMLASSTKALWSHSSEDLNLGLEDDKNTELSVLQQQNIYVLNQSLNNTNNLDRLKWKLKGIPAQKNS